VVGRAVAPAVESLGHLGIRPVSVLVVRLRYREHVYGRIVAQLDLGVGGGAEDVGSRGEADRGGARRYQVAVAFGAGAGDSVELHVVVDGQGDDGRLGDGQRHHQAGVGRGRPATQHGPARP
jgi:hypothetical protein